MRKDYLLKKYHYQAFDRDGNLLLEVYSDSAEYVIRKRREAFFTKDGMCYSRFFSGSDYVNGERAWSYDKYRKEIIY